ncbi:MAG: AAA family ATPase [Acidimicrobiales bacterium]
MSASLVDRVEERAAIESLIAGVRTGRSGALVLVGDAGIGKTVLIDFATGAADDLQVVRTIGVEAESTYPFAALHRLLAPFLDGVARLPDGQRQALDVAWGRATGPPAEPFLVGLATLSLLAEAATETAVLVCVDDAQWLDRESLAVLAFVARRVEAEGILVLFAAREGAGDLTALDGIPSMVVGGLDRADALELLHRVVDGALDAATADRVVTETAGHPLAIADLGAELSSHPVIDAVTSVEPLPLGRRLEAHYLTRVRGLPEETQAWLLLAAAEPTGDLAGITGAATTTGLDPDAGTPAERAGIVRVGPDVQFRHPLVRAAVYGGAASQGRRQAHRALADATVRGTDIDRRTWHLAAASVGPDEDVAAQLEGSAGRARERGGFAATAAALARAAELTPDSAARSRRLLAAADAAITAGSLLTARTLLDKVDGATLDEIGRGRMLLLSTDVEIQTGQPEAFARATATCLRAAELLAERDRGGAEDALVRGCQLLINAEHLLQGTTPAELAEVITQVSRPAGTPSPAALVLDGYVALATEGYERAVPALRRAVAACLAVGGDDRSLYRDLLGVTFCMMTWDEDAQTTLLGQMNDRARSVGALRDLDTVLYCQSMEATILGDLTAADLFLIDGHQMRSALGATATQWEIYRHPELLAWRGGDDQIESILQATVDASEALGNGATVAIARIAGVTLDIAHGNYAAARDAANALVAGDSLGVHSRVLPDLVEAAVRSGDPEMAGGALEALQSRAEASGTEHALGLLARSRALLAGSDEADGLYREATDRLAATSARADLARAHLLHGEWLRRQKQKTGAREQLRTAHARFTEMGAEAFAERARLELAATGERARRRTVETADDLTPQEAQIARLAAEGDTNAAIAEKLYISARTVDYHLRKVFRKLDIGSRRDLRGRFD